MPEEVDQFRAMSKVIVISLSYLIFDIGAHLLNATIEANFDRLFRINAEGSRCGYNHLQRRKVVLLNKRMFTQSQHNWWNQMRPLRLVLLD